MKVIMHDASRPRHMVANCAYRRSDQPVPGTIRDLTEIRMYEKL